MKERFYYDLHTHSCLSPCADNDNTPNNLAGMASLLGIDILALTDHNCLKNCPAFFKACERYGVVPIAGAELTTAEDIHVVCLFPNLDVAMEFDSFLEEHRNRIKNRPEIFGNQYITDENDEITGECDTLLSFATDITIDAVKNTVEKFNGIAYPAHIDRESNGIISTLGTIPEHLDFKVIEIKDSDKISHYSEKYNLSDKKIVICSDAHNLEGIRDKENYFELDAERGNSNDIINKLFEYLRS